MKQLRYENRRHGGSESGAVCEVWNHHNLPVMVFKVFHANSGSVPNSFPDLSVLINARMNPAPISPVTVVAIHENETRYTSTNNRAVP
jgi:hypothetical protein